MLVSLPIMRYFNALQSPSSSASSSSSPCFSHSPNHRRRRRRRISCCSRTVIPSKIKQLTTKDTTKLEDDGDDKVDLRISTDTAADRGSPSLGPGIEVPRQRYISVSKSALLDGLVSAMSQEEARQFLSLSQCLDSILHAEHKTILEEMRADYDLILSAERRRKSLANQESGASTNNSLENGNVDKDKKDEADLETLMSSGFNMDFKTLLDLPWRSAGKSPLKTYRVAIPGRLQRSFMKLLDSAEFEELSPRDLMLTSALNTDYLLTLPIYVDWKKASESNAIIFRRGYASERQKGLLIGEKLDYLQSKLLQNFFFLFAKPLGRFGVWLNEVSENISKEQNTEVLANKFKLWLKDLSLSLQPQSFDEDIPDELQGVNSLSRDFPISIAAQRAVSRYEGILSGIGPRERLLRKFLAWTGLLPSTPKQAFNLESGSTDSELNLSPNFLPRMSVSDIWKPASAKSCGNDFKKMLSTAISILFSQSVLQEPAYQELILLYTEEIGKRETTDQAEVPSLQMKIYERIPIPDLPVVFPYKKLSFRILDTVRLDIATIVGLLAYFFSYKFEDILSSPFAILLDVIPATAFVLYLTRVLLGYKQTRDRYQLLVNKTLYEKTIASGFGSVHFLIDASEQQQFKEAILVYATLLKQENSQVTGTRAIGHKCEALVYNTFQEKVKMPVDKAMETLVRLNLVTNKVVDGQIVFQAVPCSRAYLILRNRWNSLID